MNFSCSSLSDSSPLCNDQNSYLGEVLYVNKELKRILGIPKRNVNFCECISLQNEMHDNVKQEAYF